MVVDRTLYDILGVDPNATQDAITKAYRKKSLEHHPDRGGDVEMMQKITAAKEILSDPDKRRLYDQYGLDGNKFGGEHHTSPFAGTPWGALIESLILWSKSQKANKSKGADIEHELIVSLEDLYFGTTKTIELDRNIICNHCKGTGCNDGMEHKCGKCRGTGVETSMSQQNSTVQYSQKKCSSCNGQGDIIEDHNRCQTCSSKKTIHVKHTFDVNIPRGSQDEDLLEYPDQGNQMPDAPFDIDIDSNESFDGFQRLIKLLDHRQILINHLSGEYIQPNSYWSVKGYGMPIKESDAYGDLIIHIDIYPTENHFSTDEYRRKPSEFNTNQCYAEVKMTKYDPYQQNFQNDHHHDTHQNNKRFKPGSEGFPCSQQ